MKTFEQAQEAKKQLEKARTKIHGHIAKNICERATLQDAFDEIMAALIIVRRIKADYFPL